MDYMSHVADLLLLTRVSVNFFPSLSLTILDPTTFFLFNNHMATWLQSSGST